MKVGKLYRLEAEQWFYPSEHVPQSTKSNTAFWWEPKGTIVMFLSSKEEMTLGLMWTTFCVLINERVGYFWFQSNFSDKKFFKKLGNR